METEPSSLLLLLTFSSSLHTRRVNTWRDTIDAKPIVFECHLPSSFRNVDGPVVVRLIRALSYRIFDRVNRFYSYRGCRRKWFKWEERWMDLLSLYNWKTFRTNAIGSRESSFSFVYPFASFLSLSVLFFFPRISSSFRTDRNEGLQTRNTIGR